MVLGALWMLGAVVVLLRLAIGTFVVSRMAVRGERVVDDRWLGMMQRLAVSLGISRPLTLLRGDSVGVPVTWGILYPVVLLPSDADAWPEERRRYVLVHEMAHVKRLDAFTQLVAQMAAALFWFNPLVWLAVSRMRRERENACDDYVLTHGTTRASEYANDLLELVRSIGSRGDKVAAPAFAALAMARRSEFEGRMLSILDPEVPRASLSRTRVAVGSGAALLLIAPLAAFSPFSPQARAVVITPTATAEAPGTAQAPAARNPSAPTPAAAAMAQAPAGTTGSSCERLTAADRHHISTHSDGSGFQSLTLTLQRSSYCLEAVFDGRVTFTDDDRAVREMSPAARLRIRERTASSDREILLVPDGRGIRREYSQDGRRATYDAAAEDWFAAALLKVIRESGVDAPRRIARIARARGTDGVMEEIDAIVSSGAKAIYYAAFLGSSIGIGEAELTRLLRQAGVDFAESSGDLSQVLQAAARRNIRGQQARTAFADAAQAIESDGDKSTTLIQAAMTADRDFLIDLMRPARTIESDGDKARFLTTVGARYLSGRDSALVTSYFDVVEGIRSDGDRARTLVAASMFGHGNEAVTLGCIRATHAMQSDGDKAGVLISLAGSRLVSGPRVRDAFLGEANRIGSEGDRSRVLSALASVSGDY
jgi:hypothetical protein